MTSANTLPSNTTSDAVKITKPIIVQTEGESVKNAVNAAVTSGKPLLSTSSEATTSSTASQEAVLREFTSNVITLMGVSFILGVLCTTFILLVFDFMRRNQPDDE